MDTTSAVDGERHALTRRRILDTALELVDSEGLKALSMRRLGAALGVEAMSLYHHFPSKGELLDGLVATVLSDVPLPEATPSGWEDAVRYGFGAFRRILLAHPELFPLIANRPPVQRETLVVVARAFAILEAAGFEPGPARKRAHALRLGRFPNLISFQSSTLLFVLSAWWVICISLRQWRGSAHGVIERDINSQHFTVGALLLGARGFRGE